MINFELLGRNLKWALIMNDLCVDLFRVFKTKSEVGQVLVRHVIFGVKSEVALD